MPTVPTDRRYDLPTIWLHWITVVLVALLWTLGMTADWLPRGPWRSGAWSVHVSLGFGLSLVLVARMAWRARFGRALPPADAGLLQVVAKTMHYGLYVALAVVVLLGIANASYRGISLFGLCTVPQFGAGDAATRRAINQWHELAANLILIMALAHAAAALVHHYLWRDRLLDRMRPRP